MGAGRPSIYSLELITELCNRIASSERGLVIICKEDDDMPGYQTVFRWLADESKPEFRELYARAKEQQAELIANNTLKISDDDSNDTLPGEYGDVPNSAAVQRSKLRVDTRKWLLSKLAPKVYGDKLDVTTDGKEIKPTTTIIWGDKEVKV